MGENMGWKRPYTFALTDGIVNLEKLITDHTFPLTLSTKR